jgi:hypothetical protein
VHALKLAQLALQVMYAQRAGAAAALVYNNIDNGFIKMTLDDPWTGPALTIPSASLPASYAQPLVTAMLAGAPLTVTFGNVSMICADGGKQPGKGFCLYESVLTCTCMCEARV